MQVVKEIDLLILPEEARRELLDFYEFLLKKYVIRKKDVKKGAFFSMVEKYSFTLPSTYKFNREELYEK
jgi:predicted ATP-grasp superfamily ATP-dependent carboligase